MFHVTTVPRHLFAFSGLHVMPHLRVVAQTSCLQSGRLRYGFPPISEAPVALIMRLHLNLLLYIFDAYSQRGRAAIKQVYDKKQ